MGINIAWQCPQPQIGRQYGIKNKAAISIQFKMSNKMAALLFILRIVVLFEDEGFEHFNLYNRSYHCCQSTSKPCIYWWLHVSLFNNLGHGVSMSIILKPCICQWIHASFQQTRDMKLVYMSIILKPYICR